MAKKGLNTLSPISSVSRCSGHLAPAPQFSSFSLLLCCSPPCCSGSTPPPAPFRCSCHCRPTVIVISFPLNGSNELPSSPSDILADVFHVGHLYYFFVGDSVLPAYPKYSSKTSVLEDVDLIFVRFVHLSCLATIHLDWFNQSLL